MFLGYALATLSAAITAYFVFEYLRVRLKVDPSSWVGDFQPLLMHPDADGTEVTRPLEYEPESPSEDIEIEYESIDSGEA